MRSSPPASTYSYKFVGALSCELIDSQKAREREIETFDERWTSSEIAEPYAR